MRMRMAPDCICPRRRCRHRCRRCSCCRRWRWHWRRWRSTSCQTRGGNVVPAAVAGESTLHPIWVHGHEWVTRMPHVLSLFGCFFSSHPIHLKYTIHPNPSLSSYPHSCVLLVQGAGTIGTCTRWWHRISEYSFEYYSYHNNWLCSLLMVCYQLAIRNFDHMSLYNRII